MTRIFTSALLTTAVGACTNDSRIDQGSSGGPEVDSGGYESSSGGEVAPACQALEPGPSPIRRMTRLEYDNTVRDLLGDDTRPATNFPPEEEALGFNNNADALGVTSLLAEQYLTAAEALAADAVADLPKLLGGCDPGVQGEDTCARRLVEDLGRRAYRRPLAPGEVDDLLATFGAARDTFDFETGVRLTLTAILQSPHFLYRVEFGEPLEGAPDIAKVGPYELASRLSYLLWATMPDPELFDAAASGRLETAADVAAQTARMLADPRARAVARDFHFQWLQLANIAGVEKDASIYPDFSPELLPLMRAEAEAFIDHVVWDDEGDLDTLLLAPYTFLNGALASFYGVQGPQGDALEKVEMPAGHASGILSQGGLMTVLAKPNQTSPIHRGKFVRERLLCQIVPPPPDNLEIVPPEVDPSLPTRERFKEHSTNPLCSGCHSLMDPVGFGFEHYDGVGRWRDQEAGLPIDASGEIQSAEVAGTFDGVAELGAMLAGSPEVEACVTLQWFRYAYGRTETLDDQCTLDEVARAFSDSGRRIPDLIAALTQTDAFLYRRALPGAGGSP